MSAAREHPMRSMALRGDPSHLLVQGTLGVTMALANGGAWAREGALAAFELWLARVDPDSVRWYATSVSDRWHAVEPTSLERLRASLPLSWARGKARHLFRLRVADRASAPTTSFTYVELDEDRAPCGGYLQCTVPADGDPGEFFRMVQGLLECGLVFWAVGGALATVSPALGEASFASLRALCRRYECVDVQHPEASVWCAGAGVPSVGWLTLLGRPLLARDERAAAALLASAPGHRVVVSETPAGVLVRAGDEPTFGDVNELAYAHAYPEASHLLHAFLADEGPSFPGWGAGATRAWRRRFLEPEGWT